MYKEKHNMKTDNAPNELEPPSSYEAYALGYGGGLPGTSVSASTINSRITSDMHR